VKGIKLQAIKDSFLGSLRISKQQESISGVFSVSLIMWLETGQWPQCASPGLFRRMIVGMPDVAKSMLKTLCDQVVALDDRVTFYDVLIEYHARIDERVKRIRTVPSIGPITASAIVATIDRGKQFKNGREFATWLGLTPLNRSSGGKEHLGRISKKGDRYLRRLLVIGMTSQVQPARGYPECVHPWIIQLLERKPVRLATVAMANKAARIIWAILTKDTYYRQAAA
jgi:transposase